MRFTVITPSFNSGRFLETTLRSVIAQRDGTGAFELEHIVVDGGSSDGSLEIIERYRGDLAHVIVEPDNGPAAAINKGLRLAGGDMLAWLNADDCYLPGALARVAEATLRHPDRALYFGRCRIVNEAGAEIRHGITRFKAAFYGCSCRPLIQTINYVSQPAMFFTRRAWLTAGGLREDLTAAFDYEYILRLWRHGGAAAIEAPPLADFRWHSGSISGRAFERQFREEWEAAAADAGRWAPQTLLHALVRHAIVAVYRRMANTGSTRSLV